MVYVPIMHQTLLHAHIHISQDKGLRIQYVKGKTSGDLVQIPSSATKQ